MTTIEKIWEYIESGQSFTIFLNDGRHFWIRDRHWIGAHPSRKSSNITTYGPGDQEEHFIPLASVTSLSRDSQ
jgi:hypothetical protein